MGNVEADALYRCYQQFLEGKGYSYEKSDAERQLVFALKGEESVFKILLSVDAALNETLLYIPLPFEVDRARIMDMVLSAGHVNAKVAAGKFYVDPERSDCVYAAHYSFEGLGGFTDEYAAQVIFSAFNIAELYADKLFAVAKGQLSMQDFVKKIND